MIEKENIFNIKDIDSLKELAIKYPYFQVAYACIAKITMNTKDIERASLCTYKRQSLCDFLYEKTDPKSNTDSENRQESLTTNKFSSSEEEFHKKNRRKARTYYSYKGSNNLIRRRFRIDKK